MNIDLNKLYYYVICLIAAFVLLWGVIDFFSSLLSLSFLNFPLPYPASVDTKIDDLYQEKVLLERVCDSLARVVVSGAVFIFCRKKV